MHHTHTNTHHKHSHCAVVLLLLLFRTSQTKQHPVPLTACWFCFQHALIDLVKYQKLLVNATHTYFHICSKAVQKLQQGKPSMVKYTQAKSSSNYGTTVKNSSCLLPGINIFDRSIPGLYVSTWLSHLIGGEATLLWFWGFWHHCGVRLWSLHLFW